MISSDEIAQISAQWKLEDEIIEKDYVLGWLLWGIGNNSSLSKTWILKGGACIKKCYVNTHRYSQDLDFTVILNGPWMPDQLYPIFEELLEKVELASGIRFRGQAPKFEIRPHGGSTEGKVYFVGPRNNPNPIKIKLDITQAEDLVRPPVLRTVSHPYPDKFPSASQLYCYSLEELFAEKVRALAERHNPSDLYDILYLFRRSDLNSEPALISEILAFKCDYKGIEIPHFASVCTSDSQIEIKKRWEKMLGRDLGVVPLFEDYWDELETFFTWLGGGEYVIELELIGKDTAWQPPKLEWYRGQGEWLEVIRYSAVNRLLVDLGYDSKKRLVEPYSLRVTRDGHILFYAIKSQTREIRAYRVDRIQSIQVTNQPFKPVYRIEFTPGGQVYIPRVHRQRSFISSRSTKRYVFECPVCEKRFYRDKYNPKIGPHKQKDSPIACRGRYGYTV